MSTFDLFLQLPLFKEIDKEALFTLVPKISLDFEHFDEKKVIFSRYSSVNGLVYLLHGQACIKEGSGEEVLSGPALLSWAGIFGQNRIHTSDVITLSNCSILTVDRRSVVYLIRSEPAFLDAYLGMMSDSLFSIHSPF